MYTAFTYGSVTENKFFQKITNKQKSLHKTCDNAQIFNKNYLCFSKNRLVNF